MPENMSCRNVFPIMLPPPPFFCRLKRNKYHRVVLTFKNLLCKPCEVTLRQALDFYNKLIDRQRQAFLFLAIINCITIALYGLQIYRHSKFKT